MSYPFLLVCSANHASKVIDPTGRKIKSYSCGSKVHAALLEPQTPKQAFRVLAEIARNRRYLIQLGALSSFAQALTSDGSPATLKGLYFRWTSAPVRRRGEDTSPMVRSGADPSCVSVAAPTRLLVFDLDDEVIEGYDPFRPLETGVLPWLEANGFGDASAFWQVSSGQRTEPGSPARLRIILLLDKPYDPDHLRRYMLYRQQQGLGGDPAVYRPNQAIYTAPPRVLDGKKPAPDFLPVRSGYVMRARDHVSIPEGIEIPPRAVLRGGGVGGAATLRELAHGCEFDAISDINFHNEGLFNAVWWTRKREPEVTLEELRERLRRHVRELPLKRRDEYLARIAGQELDGWWEWIGQALEGERFVVEGIEPAFPAREVPVVEAVKTLQHTVERFLDQGGQWLISGAPGLGKTTEVLRQMTRPIKLKTEKDSVTIEELEEALAAGQVDIYAPTNDLVDEMLAKCAELGVPAAAIRGRGYSPAPGEVPPLCRRMKVFNELTGAKLPRMGSIACCRANGGRLADAIKCRHFEECEYIDQFSPHRSPRGSVGGCRASCRSGKVLGAQIGHAEGLGEG